MNAKEIPALPDWCLKGIVEPLQAGIASVFIVHGDTNCLVRNPDAEDEPDEAYIPIRKFFEKTFEDREIVIFYNIANGAWFLSGPMERKFRKAVGLEDPATDGADPTAAAKAALAAKRGIPKESASCLPLIERALREMEGVAVVIMDAHFIAPASGAGNALPLNERADIARLRIWGRSTQIRAQGNVVLLMTDQAAKVSLELRQADSEIRTAFIPKPDEDERRAYIDDSLPSGKGKRKTDLSALAKATQGMSLRQIGELFLAAKAAGGSLALGFVKDKKREMLNAEYGEVMEVIEPRFGLDDIGGHDHIKTRCRSILEALRAGEIRLVPQGMTIMGPPGTGKSAFAEALAQGAGFLLVRIKNIRSMWVGESEARMEKLLAGLRSLAPCIVVNDEADLAEAGRDSYKGDSGVSERLMKMWMEFLSDPSIRGKVIVLNITNRPDRIDPALKRSGRSDERWLMAMPSLEERLAIFGVMARRHELTCEPSAYDGCAELTEGFSGADIEKIALSAFRFAAERGKKTVDAEAWREAVTDFIPSASAAEIDAMTMAGLLECSSRRMLPPHLPKIVEDIRRRGLIAGMDDLLAQLRERNILPAEELTSAGTSAN